MAESLRVFVSSVMTRGYLAAERERARRAIDSLLSIARVIDPRVATVIRPPGTPVGGLISVSV